MVNSVEESWKKFLNPDILKTNLIISSLFIAVFEISKETIISRIREFYSTGFDKTEPIIDSKYQTEVLSKNKSRLYASLLWLKKNEVINEQDLTNFEKIKTHRNELAHEMISYISNKNYTIEIELFSTLVNLIDKIEKWWIINVEMAIDSEPNNHEITENEIIPGISMSIKLLIDIALGLEKEPRYFYDHLVNSNKKPALYLNLITKI